MVASSSGPGISSVRLRGSSMFGSTGSRWIDISVPLHSGMTHWPGDPSVQIERIRAIERGDSSNLTQISMGSHTGTHMDAPFHFIPKGACIDEMPLETTIGRARVIEISDPESIKAEELIQHQIRRGERILFKTRNSSRAWKTDRFVTDYVFISEKTARFLAKRGVRVIGIDYLSVGGFQSDGAETHRALLEAGIWLIEGLNLSHVKPGRYYLICVPLKVKQGDGAPARAIIRPV